MRLLIVGGVAGGASAAARARRLDESAEIILFERGPDVSFANCGLPYYVGGEIVDRDRLLVTTPEQLTRRFRLDVRTGCEVVGIDSRQKRVKVRKLTNGQPYDESYDKLILAPGAAPIRPPLPGIDLPGIYSLRTLADADRIKQSVDAGARSAVIVGAGFIGLELAENLVHRGLKVTLVELQDQVLPPLDREMTAGVVRELKAHGVELLLGESARSFERSGEQLCVRLKSGCTVEADLIIVGVGVRPESTLAAEAGLAVGSRGGIRVNANMQTSDPDVYAVGDVVETTDLVTGTPVQVPLAGPANRQGRIAASHIFGRRGQYQGTQATAIVRVFGVTAACTGAAEKTLLRLNVPYRKIYAHPTQHAGYYPGAESMQLKLLFSPEGRLLGAQAVGRSGVDKRIDVLAVAVRAGLTVWDLESLELAYAPQYGSAKDPVNMLGFVAAGLLDGDHPQASVEDLVESAESSEPPCLLDVRTQREYDAGHIPGAINLPVDELRDRLAELDPSRSFITYCEVGQRGYLATRILLQNGYQAANLAGGFRTYQAYRTTGGCGGVALEVQMPKKCQPKNQRRACACGKCEC